MALRQRQSIRKRICQCRELRLKIVFREANGRKVAECGAGELKVRGDIQTVVHARATANHSIWIQCISKSQARRPVVTVDSHVAVISSREHRSTKQVRTGREDAWNINGH